MPLYGSRAVLERKPPPCFSNIAWAAWALTGIAQDLCLPVKSRHLKATVLKNHDPHQDFSLEALKFFVCRALRWHYG